ncbi:hypothetical protein [Arthrobacter sp. R4-81]
MDNALLAREELPPGFDYPPEFLRLIELDLLTLEPWWVITGENLRTRYVGLKERYPQRRLVPFARREDNDDVACWDLETGQVSIVHDFASPGWERREEYADFSTWLHVAIDDMLEFR